LPGADGIYGVEEHENIEEEAVAYPQGEDEFGKDEEEEGAPPAKPLG
jgi:hypothetical protein